ncbi:MAG: hypothetical protein ACTSRG_27390 [Candidatus Helarchaeota archaeon]
MDFLNIERLKTIALPPTNLLKFKIDFLKIKINGIWHNFKELSGKIPSPFSSTEFPIKLNDILLDTGNEAGYCCLSKGFHQNFKYITKLNDEAFEDKIKKTFTGNRIIDIVTKNKFEFSFLDNVIFVSKLGFSSNIPLGWIHTITQH